MLLGRQCGLVWLASEEVLALERCVCLRSISFSLLFPIPVLLLVQRSRL